MCEAAHGIIKNCCLIVYKKKSKIIKTISIETFTSSFFLSNDATVSVKNSLLFFFTQAVKAVKTVMTVIFSLVEIKTEML